VDEDFKELYELTAKLARRCVYDLRHCVDQLPARYQAVYRPRMENYETIFEAATGSKDYRHRLHRTISQQASEIKRLSELLTQHGINIPEEHPF
jgi:hypothetical protein